MRRERALDRLRAAPLNFEPQPLYAYTPDRGWHADALSQRLPAEGPGDPAPGGPWQIARRLVEDYRIADPAVVRATWNGDAPLDGREMLLELRLYRILRAWAGVRVTRVWDEDRVLAGRPTRVFGYEYATLRGHVEMGRMDYEVCKWRDDGAVEFRLHAHSRASGEGAPWVRLGFRLFGRRQQLQFYRRCCERVADLTARELGMAGDPPPPAARLREADAPETAGIGERLLPRRTRRRPG
jgi:uncharacterized protein (UPF0548 family)